MSTLTENDDIPEGDELIPVDTPPEAPEIEADDEDDGDDERLAQSEDDHEDDVTANTGTNNERRRKRRDAQKRARDAAQRELEYLRSTVATLSQRVAATENHATAANVQSIQQRLAQAQAEVQQAERIIAMATEAGNGNDVVAALRIRDEATATAQQLAAAQSQFERARNAPPPIDPNVVNYAKEWMQANPWYDPNARDRDSALTKAIDNELAREGYNPSSREYWEELTSRVSEAVGGGDDTDNTPTARPRRKAPPTGNTREHAPTSTKREIYVTPERKQAMIEAGVWDDPSKRQSMLRAYQAFDKSSAR